MLPSHRCPGYEPGNAIDAAISKCPFLKEVCTSEGEGYARRLAVNPYTSAKHPGSQPVFPEDLMGSLRATIAQFHGDNGVLPLQKFSESRVRNTMQYHNATSSTEVLTQCNNGTASVIAAPHPLVHAPMASMSLSGPFNFLPDPAGFFKRNPKSRNAKQNKHKKPNPQSQPNTSTGNGNNSTPGTSQNKPTSSPNSNNYKGNSSTKLNAASTQASGASGNKSGSCPMRKWMGPMTALLPVAASGRLQCPPAIVAMRAAVAGLKPVRDLRPQALPIRSLALAGTTIAANIPQGMWREHTEKFSFEWFVAVHATIPFIAMLRKAVLMPKWAMLLTVAGAIAGQQCGALMERQRLAAKASKRVTLNGGNNANTGDALKKRNAVQKSSDKQGLGCRYENGGDGIFNMPGFQFASILGNNASNSIRVA